jgi:hypothetical protein
LAHVLASSSLGREPKARVATHTLKNRENELVTIKGQMITWFKMRIRTVYEVESSGASCKEREKFATKV